MSGLDYNLVLVFGMLTLLGLYAIKSLYNFKKDDIERAEMLSKYNGVKTELGKLKSEFRKIQTIDIEPGSVDVNGILGEFGIDEKLLDNPVVKQLINRYLPTVLDKVAKTPTNDNIQTQQQTY